MDKVVNTIRALIALVLLILVLIFCFQNREETNIQFLSFQITGLPLFIALFGVLSFGGFVGYLFGLISGSRRKNKKIEKEKAKIEATEQKPTPSIADADKDAITPSL